MRASFEAELEGASILLLLDYRGLSVAEIKALRVALAKEGDDATLRVVKNTVMKRAIADGEYAELAELLKGPSALVIAKGDQIQPVKALRKYLKDNKKENEIRGGLMEGRALSAAEVKSLAEMPSLPELQAKLAGAIASPTVGLVNVLASPLRALANVLDQYGKTLPQD